MIIMIAAIIPHTDWFSDVGCIYLFSAELELHAQNNILYIEYQ